MRIFNWRGHGHVLNTVLFHCQCLRRCHYSFLLLCLNLPRQHTWISANFPPVPPNKKASPFYAGLKKKTSIAAKTSAQSKVIPPLYRCVPWLQSWAIRQYHWKQQNKENKDLFSSGIWKTCTVKHWHWYPAHSNPLSPFLLHMKRTKRV